jgi:hypothetical protein
VADGIGPHKAFTCRGGHNIALNKQMIPCFGCCLTFKRFDQLPVDGPGFFCRELCATEQAKKSGLKPADRHCLASPKGVYPPKFNACMCHDNAEKGSVCIVCWDREPYRHRINAEELAGD